MMALKLKLLTFSITHPAQVHLRGTAFGKLKIAASCSSLSGAQCEPSHCSLRHLNQTMQR